jgi:predicted nucleotidyltransferase
MEVRSVEAVVRALNEAKVRYLIVGGVAVNVHGYVRLTMDLDLVIQLKPENIEAAWEAMERIGYRARIPVSGKDFADEKKRELWRKEKGMLVLQFWSDEHRRTQVDVFVREPFDFDREHATAPDHAIVPGVVAKVVGWDTLIKMKKEAGRLKDLADLEMLEKIARLK